MSTSRTEFIKRLHNLPHLRQNIDKIQPESTVVICLAEDLQKAVEHYGVYCNPLPEFRVLDWKEGCSSGIAGVGVGPAGDLEGYVHKEKCLYVTPHRHPWDGYDFAAKNIKNIGITKYYIEDSSEQYFRWINDIHINTEMVFKNIPRIILLYDLLEDEESKDVFLAALKSRLTRTKGYFSLVSYPLYHHPNVPLCEGDIIIDAGIGVYITPSIEFSSAAGATGRVLSFEPDPASFSQAKENLRPYFNITLENLGLWKECGETSFVSTGDDSAHLGKGPAEQTVTCQLTDLDSYLERHDLRCDFIKMDIEGAELDALHGAERTLKKYRPKLAICVYHRPFEQLFTIFSYLYELDLGYRFYMGHHLPYHNDTVLYAIAADNQMCGRRRVAQGGPEQLKKKLAHMLFYHA